MRSRASRRQAPCPFPSSYRPRVSVRSLGDDFYDKVSPARFPKHDVRFRNAKWPCELASASSDPKSGSRTLPNSIPLPRTSPAPLPSATTGISSMFATLTWRRSRLSPRVAGRRRRPPSRSRDERRRNDAVVTRRGRTPHAEGRRPRSARHGDARRLRPKHVEVAESLGDRRELLRGGVLRRRQALYASHRRDRGYLACGRRS